MRFDIETFRNKVSDSFFTLLSGLLASSLKFRVKIRLLKSVGLFGNGSHNTNPTEAFEFVLSIEKG